MLLLSTGTLNLMSNDQGSIINDQNQPVEDFATAAKEVEHSPKIKTEMVEEIHVTPEIEKKIEGYVEKIEKEAELQKPVTDDYTQQVLINSSAPQNPKITLPLTDDQIQQGLHHKVWEAIRWLAEWCVRQMKMLS